MQKGKFIIVLSILLMCSTLFAPVISHAEKSIKDVKKERKDIKKNLSDAEKKAADILIEIDDLNKEINQLEDILIANEKEIESTNKDIDKEKAEIEKIKKRIQERFQILRDRAKSYQASGGNLNFLDVLFDAEDFNEFISRVTAVSKIADADNDLIEEQKKDKKKVESKLEQLEELKAELKGKREEIKAQKKEKNEASKELNSKKAELEETVKKLEIKDDKLSDLQSKLTSQASASGGINFAANTGNGELGWPTDGGYISSPMGQRWGRTHKGIDIARTDRSVKPPIYAAESGTVEVAGVMNGYGNAVIVNHGNGMKTLYGHMTKLTVHSGQKVDRGQQIGVMGSTGNSTGVHLHFEVHINGQIQNPIGYLN